jgi:hypothetical protein
MDLLTQELVNHVIQSKKNMLTKSLDIIGFIIIVNNSQLDYSVILITIVP